MDDLVQRLRLLGNFGHDNHSTAHDAADAIERLTAERDSLSLAYKTSEDDVFNLTQKVIPNLRAERDVAIDALRRAGFVECDIPACNCGSWHARYGFPERWRELADQLEEAGHPLCNENGNLMLNALRELVAERDALKTDNSNLRTVMIAAAEEIHRHWSVHCDADGYGPANLQRRLEDGIPAEYGYTAGAFAELQAKCDALQAKLDAILNVCNDLRNNVSDHKDYEGYAEGWIDACNECMWALQKEQHEQV